MCIAFLLLEVHPLYSLIVASNRDEFYGRPTLPAHFWENSESILAGKDEKGGGTWFGMTRTGRMALLTNFRELKPAHGAPSRGNLTRDFLEAGVSPQEYLEQIYQQEEPHNGYNLIVADTLANEVVYYSNRNDGLGPQSIAPGIYGLSNALLDTPWPKVTAGKERMAAMVAASGGAELSPEDIIHTVLGDTTLVEDAALPQTEVPIEIERRLSSAFVDTNILGRAYGTSTQTVMLVRRDGKVEWHERFLDTTKEKLEWTGITTHWVDLLASSSNPSSICPQIT